MALVALVVALHASAGTVPTFPIDFYSGTQQNVVISQGGSVAGAQACCAPDAPQCKVQTINAGSDEYQQGSMNRTLSIGGATGVTMSWYGAGIDKQMALVPGTTINSTHKYACALYCPLRGKKFASLVAIAPAGDRVRDLGQKVIEQPGVPGGQSKICQGYGWTEHLLKIIPMAQHEMWVDPLGTPKPFVAHDKIVPFGKGPPLGYETTSFVGFQQMDVSDQFDIDMPSIEKCKRQTEGKCPGDPPSGPHEIEDEQTRAYGALLSTPLRKRSTVLEQMEEVAAAAGAVMVEEKTGPLDGASVPAFPQDYVSEEHFEMLIAQGGFTRSAAGICCSSVKVGQCQVQQGKGSVTRYVDFTNQRVRVEDHAKKTIQIHDYTKKIAINVNVSATGVETCEAFCPMAAGEQMHPFVLPDNAKDHGRASYEGRPAELYEWKETVFGIIPMSSITMFVGNASGAADANQVVPLFEVEVLTPLGQQPPIGTHNVTYTSFTPGAPPAAKFDIAGMATCKPLAPQACIGPAMQAQRLAAKQYRTWAMYEGAFNHE